jgi:hypothetical protein
VTDWQPAIECSGEQIDTVAKTSFRKWGAAGEEG